MDYVTRINLKTACEDRKKLLDFCLNNPEKQYLAIGWSYVYDIQQEIKNYEQYYNAVKSNVPRINHVLNSFYDAKENDLYWTRDLQGFYWICRVKSGPIPYHDEPKDIGALLPVEAYKYGLEVPGQIKASFNRPRGGTAEDLYDQLIVEFSKKAYNDASETSTYELRAISSENWLNNLPDFELEELVIAYIQIKHNYYVLSNSIANKSTTLAIECEFMSRYPGSHECAVVQVKGPKCNLNADDYIDFLDKGYKVFLYANNVRNDNKYDNVVAISYNQLLQFYDEYESNLPHSITKWKEIL